MTTTNNLFVSSASLSGFECKVGLVNALNTKQKAQLSLGKTSYSVYSSCCTVDFYGHPRSMIFILFEGRMRSLISDHRLNGSSSPVLTATSLSYGEAKNSTLHRIKIPDRIEIKFGAVDYVGEGTRHAKFYANTSKEGFSAYSAAH